MLLSDMNPPKEITHFKEVSSIVYSNRLAPCEHPGCYERVGRVIRQVVGNTRRGEASLSYFSAHLLFPIVGML